MCGAVSCPVLQDHSSHSSLSRGLSLDPVLSQLVWKRSSPGILLSLCLPHPALRTRVAGVCGMPGLLRGYWDLNSSPYDCAASTIDCSTIFSAYLSSFLLLRKSLTLLHSEPLLSCTHTEGRLRLRVHVYRDHESACVH